MERRLNNLFDNDYHKTYAHSHEKIVHTYQTKNSEEVFGKEIKGFLDTLNINEPTTANLYIENNTPNDDLRFGDSTSQSYIIRNNDDLNALVKNTHEQFVSILKNLIRGREDLRITTWWIILCKQYRKGGYNGNIRIKYDILSQPNERGASTIYRKYEYNLDFMTARKDYHF